MKHITFTHFVSCELNLTKCTGSNIFIFCVSCRAARAERPPQAKSVATDVVEASARAYLQAVNKLTRGSERKEVPA